MSEPEPKDATTGQAPDDPLYFMSAEESAFLKSHTGIEGDQELRDHISAIKAKAYKIHPYPCIQRLRFTKFTMSRFPAYKHALKLGQEREGVILLDIGCCFGNEIRKAVADGFPIQNVIASDLRSEYWELGHELFRSTPETFPVKFIPGDIFDPSLLSVVSPFYELPQTSVPPLSSLNSLNPLRGHISIIHAASFFHLFDEERQLEVAQALASLLSPLPGSTIFGGHLGGIEKGSKTRGERQIFFHSPESWCELWDGNVFKKGTVAVETGLKEVIGRNPLANGPIHYLYWSVTRL